MRPFINDHDLKEKNPDHVFMTVHSNLLLSYKNDFSLHKFPYLLTVNIQNHLCVKRKKGNS